MFLRASLVISLICRHCDTLFDMYTAVYEKVPQGYVAWLEEIPGVLTQGKTKRETEENLKDAFREFVLAQ